MSGQALRTLLPSGGSTGGIAPVLVNKNNSFKITGAWGPMAPPALHLWGDDCTPHLLLISCHYKS
jgi:hypothetical protein